MVGNGNHPLKQPSTGAEAHIDEITLQEYVLGQLLPHDEQVIRQHLQHCAECRNRANDLTGVVRQTARGLHEMLEEVEPSPGLSFDAISAEWRQPPRRLNLFYRLRELAPSPPSMMLLALFIVGFLLLLPGDGTAALRSLNLPEQYSGPPLRAAAATDHGLFVVEYAGQDVDVVLRLPGITAPYNLSFSPGGSLLCFGQNDALWLFDLDDGRRQRLDVQPGANWAWSDDGLRLAYTDGSGQLFVFDTAAWAETLLVPAREHAWGAPVWTANGGHIAYASLSPLPEANRVAANAGKRTQQGIWQVDVVTGFRVQLARNPQPTESLIVPVQWVSSADERLLAWDIQAATTGRSPALFVVDAGGHSLQPLDGVSQVAGDRLAWPLSPQGTLLAADDGQLTAFHLAQSEQQVIPDQLPWPYQMAWSPNGAWLAYTVAGTAEGHGLYLFALNDGLLRAIELPAGALEKQVMWAGAEHLLVVRQALHGSQTELWLASLTEDTEPQRLMTNINLPQQVGWRWQDVISATVLAN